MERAPLALCLVITLLTFHFLAPSNAVPLSRGQRLSLLKAGGMPATKGTTPSPEPKGETGSLMPKADAMINARMVLETQDYAPSGPNNHHKPPGWS